MRFGYLTEDQFAETLSDTFQATDPTLDELAGRGVGAAAPTDILDRAAADARYALSGTTALSDGDYGDVIVSGGGTVMTVDATIDGENF